MLPPPLLVGTERIKRVEKGLITAFKARDVEKAKQFVIRLRYWSNLRLAIEAKLQPWGGDSHNHIDH